MPLDILHEDNHLLVVNKPAGLATMGVTGDEPSVVRLAKEYLKEKYQKPGNVYLGVVSRLDALVSGVLAERYGARALLFASSAGIGIAALAAAGMLRAPQPASLAR